MDATAVAAAAAAKEETVTDLLKLDDLKLEMGYALLALVNGPRARTGSPTRSRPCAASSRRNSAS